MDDTENPQPDEQASPQIPAEESEQPAPPPPPASTYTTAPQQVRVVVPPQPARRRGWIPAIGGLVAGAVLGAAAGAGAAVLVVQGTRSTTVTNGASGPETITVNDTESVNAVSAVAAQAIDSVVTISVTGDGTAGTGSGVVLDSEGHIATNTHVVTLEGSTADPQIRVTTSSGHVYDATIVGTDPLMDLAVIQVQNAPELVPIEFADSSKLNVGDVTVAIGAPLGYAGTVTSGIISALDRSIQVASSAVPEDSGDNGQNPGSNPFQFDLPGVPQQSAQGYIELPVIQTDTAINPGNSGGALLDVSGRLIGINVAIAGDTGGSVGVGFAIPSNTVKRITDELIANGTATHGLLGVSVVNADASAGIVGASVKQVTAGGAADKAGLKAGDIIIDFDGVPITSANDLTAQVRTHGVGDTVDLSYVRGDQTLTTTVTLGDLSSAQS